MPLIRKASRAIRTLVNDHQVVAPEPEPVGGLTPQEPDGFYFPNSAKKHTPGSVYQTVSDLGPCAYTSLQGEQNQPDDFLYAALFAQRARVCHLQGRHRKGSIHHCFRRRCQLHRTLWVEPASLGRACTPA
jgi:hypothetical protein